MTDTPNAPKTTKIIKVAKTSSIPAVAGAIANFLREEKEVAVQAVGNSTVLMAVKAITLATKYMAEEKVPILFSAEFFTVGENKEVYGIRFTVYCLTV